LYERARHHLITTKLSPLGQFVRWTFGQQRVPLSESGYAVACRPPSTNGTTGIDAHCAILSAEGAWGSCAALLDEADARSRPGSRGLGETPAERYEERRMCLLFHDLMCAQTERIFLAHVIDDKSLALPVVTQGAPLMQRLFVRFFYPLWKRRVRRAYKLNPETIKQDLNDVRAAFMEAWAYFGNLSRAPNDAAFRTSHVAFTAFSALVRLQRDYGVPLPELESCSEDFGAIVREFNAHPAASLTAVMPPALDLTADPRNPRLKRLSFRRNPRLLLAVARLARRFFPVIRFGKFVVLSRHKDVVGALARDDALHIAPINARRIADVNHGPFILGLDAGPQHSAEYAHLYAAYRPYDIDRVRSLVTREATRLLDGADARGGAIDVVNSYARLAAARTAVTLLGIAGPSEADLMRVIRRMFHHTFLNLRDTPVTRDRAIEAASELKQWITSEIERRHDPAHRKDDFLGRMLDATPRPHDAAALDLIRRNISGMLAGAIDTTVTSVANIVYVLLTRTDVRSQVEADIEYPVRFRAWCWEILRLWPHNPLLLRQSACPVQIGNAAIREGKRVVAFTLAAMHDPLVFEKPNRLDLGRPESNYLHFGAGIHVCAGRDFNRIQVPELVRLLLLRGPSLVGRLRFEGPFPDELIVKLMAR
jgi:cytochrome P450